MDTTAIKQYIDNEQFLTIDNKIKTASESLFNGLKEFYVYIEPIYMNKKANECNLQILFLPSNNILFGFLRSDFPSLNTLVHKFFQDNSFTENPAILPGYYSKVNDETTFFPRLEPLNLTYYYIINNTHKFIPATIPQKTAFYFSYKDQNLKNNENNKIKSKTLFSDYYF